jgi:hypothetical protein
MRPSLDDARWRAGRGVHSAQPHGLLERRHPDEAQGVHAPQQQRQQHQGTRLRAHGPCSKSASPCTITAQQRHHRCAWTAIQLRQSSIHPPHPKRICCNPLKPSSQSITASNTRCNPLPRDTHLVGHREGDGHIEEERRDAKGHLHRPRAPLTPLTRRHTPESRQHPSQSENHSGVEAAYVNGPEGPPCRP